MSYLEYRNHAINVDPQTGKICCSFFGKSGKIAASLKDLQCRVITASRRETALAGYTVCDEIQTPSVKFPTMPDVGHWDLTFRFSAPGKKLPDVTLEFRLYADRIEISASGAAVRWHGMICCGDDAEHELLAVSDIAADDILYCASGPAANYRSTMLYNRKDDSALKCSGGTMALTFDWEKGEYCCDFTVPDGETISFGRAEKICQNLFQLPAWTPLSKAHQFATPPVGWMTWYSLRFDTCEAAVLENAQKMHDLFQNFAEKICIWVDWEWCHADFSGYSSDGFDIFHPRKDAYPNGLKYVSDAIRELGEIPAIWCGATVEGRVNKFMKKHPETLLADFALWPGHLWFDMTNPLVAREYIPEVFKQLFKWGYEVFKWDCWLNSVRVHDEFHDRCYDPEKSIESCQRELVSAAREVIGGQCYLLGCTIDSRTSLATGDLYDGFRIGGDVFSWQDFLDNGVKNTFYFYPLHNTQLYLDPDTLVLRSEYSDDFQARTRVAFLALTGLQLTVGDQLKALDELRIDALKRAMPVAEIRPVEMIQKVSAEKTIQTITAIARPFGSWYVSGNFNFDKRSRKIKLSYSKLALPKGKYAAFEFWEQHFIGISEKGFELSLKSGGSAVVRLTPVGDHPVLIGSTRHLLQGAVEFSNIHWDDDKAELSGETLVCGDDPVTLTFYVPDNWSAIGSQEDVTVNGNLIYLKLYAGQNTRLNWKLRFKEK